MKDNRIDTSMIAFKRHPHLSMQLSEAGTSVLFCGQRRNSKKPLWFAVICALTLAHWGKWLGMIHRNTTLKGHKHRDLLWHHQDYLTLLIGSDDLTLSKRAPSLTIARLQEFFSSDCDLLFANSRFWSSFCQFNLQKFFSSDFDLLFFSNSWSPEAIKRNGHLRQVPRVATDPATTPVLRPLPFKTSDRSNNWIGGNLNMDIWGKVWVCFLYKTMYLSNSLRIFCQTSKGNNIKRRQEKNKTRN